MIAIEEKAAAYDKACKLAAAATKKNKASYTVVLHTLLEMSKWKDAQRRTPSDDTTEVFVHIVIGEVACHETDLQRTKSASNITMRADGSLDIATSRMGTH